MAIHDCPDCGLTHEEIIADTSVAEAEAAVQIAEIEAETTIALAEIHAAENAAIAAELEDDMSEEDRARIAALEASNAELRTALEEMRTPPPAPEPEPVVVEVEEPPAVPAPEPTKPEPPKEPKRKNSWWS